MKTKCFCGSHFFIDHFNGLSFIKPKVYYHLLHRQLDLKYSIFECVFCRRMYLACQSFSDTIEELTPISEVDYNRVNALITRAKLIGKGYPHFNEKFGMNLITNNLKRLEIDPYHPQA